jgi:hypothetical protein
MFTRLKRFFSRQGDDELAARVAQLSQEKRVLVDQLRQIEFRLAMCRNTAFDVYAAHNIAVSALLPHGGVLEDSAIIYQRRMVREERALRVVA